MPAKNQNREDKNGAYYHVFNKGVDKRVLFNDEEDYRVFCEYLKDYLTTPLDPEHVKKEFTVKGKVFRGTPHQPKNYFNKVELIAYSLNSDRFHLILHPRGKGALESFIRSLCTRYSIYFNKKYKRTGSLFEGPYKSVAVGDEPSLLHLTRYLHHESEHSSYEDYLGLRQTPWVKSNIVLSSFGKGASEYKELVENYELDQNGKELIKDITFESETEYLERRGLTRKDENRRLETPAEDMHLGINLKPRQRIPEFLATTVIFLLLLSLGIRNITAKAVEAPNPSPAPTVLSETAVVEETQPIIMVTIKINDQSDSVNIRQKSTTNSSIIGKAHDGDNFELVSKIYGWYEVKLADGSTGYISSIYIKEGETNP